VLLEIPGSSDTTLLLLILPILDASVQHYQIHQKKTLKSWVGHPPKIQTKQKKCDTALFMNSQQVLDVISPVSV
jgi:hypothetical protein